MKTLCYSHRSTWLFAHPQNRSSSVFGHQPNKSSSLFFTKLGTDADLGCHRRTPRMSPYRPRRTWRTPPFATTTAYCCDWVVLGSWDTGLGFVEECTVTHYYDFHIYRLIKQETSNNLYLYTVHNAPFLNRSIAKRAMFDITYLIF